MQAGGVFIIDDLAKPENAGILVFLHGKYGGGYDNCQQNRRHQQKNP